MVSAVAALLVASASASAVVVGRCGPSFGNAKCESHDGKAVYCNLANGWCTNTLSHEQAHPWDFVAPEGRCGPLFGGAKCKAEPGWAIFCNEATGWCGDDDAHRDAQPGDKHDFKIPDGRCGPRYGSPKIASCTGKPAWAIYCNEMAGFCGNTEAHRQAQRGTSYDYKPPLYVVVPRDVADHPSLGLSATSCDYRIKTVDECAAAALALKLPDTSPSAAATKSYDPVGCYLQGAHLKIDEQGVLGKCTGYHQCVCRTKFVATVECLKGSEYEYAPPTATADRVCKPLTTCAPGEFMEADATSTSDRVCTTHGECVPGQFQSKPPSATSDRQCTALTTCVKGAQFESEAPQTAKDRVCSALTTCASGEYESQAPTDTMDRHCATVYECKADAEYEISAPTAVADRQCRALTTCLPHQFESIAPSASSDRKCDTIKYCGAEEFQTHAPTATSNRVCQARTVCSATEWETKAATTTSDRTCKALTVCTESQWQSRAPGRTTDRLCTALTVCTAAQYEARAATSTRNRLCYELTTCTADEFESQKESATADRVCTAIKLCPAGKYRNGNTAVSGGTCADCDAGSYKSNVGFTWRTACRKCARGRFSKAGAVGCALCVTGRFQSDRGQSGCAACPTGRYSELEGRVALAQCVHCPSGKFAGSAGSAKCALCSAGTFGDSGKATNHENHCVACPTGRFQKNDGSTDCVSCPNGQFQHKPQQVYCRSCEDKLEPYTGGRIDARRTYWTAGVAGASSCVQKPVDCKLDPWTGAWGECSKSCETGLQTETRGVAIAMWGGGVPCRDEDKTREQECNRHECPIDCVWSGWGSFNQCSKSCGTGTQTRTRSVKVSDRYGGKSCPGKKTYTQQCNKQPCAVDCVVSSWGAWGECTAKCSSGRKTRTRKLVEPSFGGKACPGASEVTDCNQFCCKGHYHVDGTNECKPCLPGTFAAVLGMEACDVCASGSYQPNAAAASCLDCPKGTHQPLTGRTHRTHCIDCPQGKFQEADGSDKCEACAAGKYNSNTASSVGAESACTKCNAGTYAAREASSGCTLCPVGTFQDSFGQAACTQCASGRFNAYPGRASERYCLYCPCGKWSVAESVICADCTAGKFRRCFGDRASCDGGHTDSDCQLAQPGFYALEKSCKPAKCAPGYYQTAPGKGDCAACPAGKANANNGSNTASDCLECSAGRFAEAGDAVCTKCDAGRFVVARGSTSSLACKACAKGHFAALAGADRCDACAKGKYQTEQGQSDCDVCAAGRFAKDSANTLASHCVACPKGTHQEASGSSSCATCVAGTYQDTKAAELCNVCPAGTSSNKLGATRASDCALCQEGTYATEAKSTSCTACPKGRASAIKGAHLESECTYCSAGTFADEEGLAACKDCAKGTFAAKDGHHHCIKCPSGQYQEADGMSACVDCKSGTYTHQSKHDMITCEKCGVLDAARKFHTRGMAGQSQCWPIPVDCAAKAWGGWGTCSLSCGTGEQVRTRRPQRHPATGKCAVSVCTAGWGGGKSCDAIRWSETQPCNTHPCPIDCVVSAWAAWEPCSKSCGGGVTHRVRTITVHPQYGGKACPAEREPVSGFNTCNVHACSWEALPECHERHVKCDIKHMSLESKWHKLKPSCAHSAVEEDAMCWGETEGCTKASKGQKCHTADTAAERAQAARHVGEKFDTLIVQHDRKNMLQYGQFKCTRSAERECTCKCNRHPPCCAQKNKLLSLPNLGAGQRYTGIGRPQECCNICTNHPGCKAWEYDASESVCVLKKGTPRRSSFIDVPPGSGVETYAGVAGEFENCKWGAERVDVPVQQMFDSRAAWRADGATPRVTPAAASP